MRSVRDPRLTLASLALTTAALTAAFPAQAQDAPLWPDLASAAPAPLGASSKDAAVIVSIETYTKVNGVGLPSIRGAGQNGNDWYNWFVTTRRLEPERVQLLRDGGATKEEIFAALERATSMVKTEGRIWVIFIGHGAPSGTTKEGVLLGADTQATANSIDARGVPQRVLLDKIASSYEAPVVVLDACFSGKNMRGDPFVKDLQFVVPVGLLDEKRAHVLTAAHADQFAGRLPGAKRPAFSYLVLGALRGWADTDRNGVVTVAETVSYSQRTLASFQLGRTQEPEYAGPDATLALASEVHEDGPSLVDIVRRMPPDGPEPLEQRHIPAKKGLVISGAVVGGVGLVGLGLGSYFLAKAFSKNSDSDSFCTGNTCRAEGVSLRHDAVSGGRTATWFFLGGAVASVVGAGLLYVGRGRTVEVEATASNGGAGARLLGTF